MRMNDEVNNDEIEKKCFAKLKKEKKSSESEKENYDRQRLRRSQVCVQFNRKRAMQKKTCSYERYFIFVFFTFQCKYRRY